MYSEMEKNKISVIKRAWRVATKLPLIVNYLLWVGSLSIHWVRIIHYFTDVANEDHKLQAHRILCWSLNQTCFHIKASAFHKNSSLKEKHSWKRMELISSDRGKRCEPVMKKQMVGCLCHLWPLTTRGMWFGG